MTGDNAQGTVDWVDRAKQLFRREKPAHFTDYRHCCECAEHDQTLLNATIDTIGLDELGNPGWDPVCFASAEGKQYYFPAFVRLSLDSIDHEFYFGQLLFHLEGSGAGNALFSACSEVQRQFVASFVEHMIFTYPEQLEACCSVDDALRVLEYWSPPA